MGALCGRTLENSTTTERLQSGQLQAVRIPAADRALHFPTLRVFDDTQVIPLGGAEAVMTDRRC